MPKRTDTRPEATSSAPDPLDEPYPTGWTREVQQRLLAPFATEEVGWLPRAIKNGKALGLAFITARLVARRLDEVVGPGNWSFSFKAITPDCTKVQLDLKVFDTIRSEMGESKSEDEKGKSAVSDAIKRAAVHFGIGRYLYFLPKNWYSYDTSKERWVETPAVGQAQLETALRNAGYRGVRKPVPQPAPIPPEEVAVADEEASELADAPEMMGDDLDESPFSDEQVPAAAAAPSLDAQQCGCGKPLAKAQADASAKQFGQPMCPDCVREHIKQKSAADEQAAPAAAAPAPAAAPAAAPRPEPAAAPAAPAAPAPPAAPAAPSANGQYEAGQQVPSDGPAVHSGRISQQDLAALANLMTGIRKEPKTNDHGEMRGQKIFREVQTRFNAVLNKGRSDDQKIRQLDEAPQLISHKGKMYRTLDLATALRDHVYKEIEEGLNVEEKWK